MPPHVHSPMGRLNFFSGLRDSESSRQSELSRAFVSPRKAHEYGKTTHASHRLAGKINIQMPDNASRIGDIRRPGTCEINCEKQKIHLR